MEELLGIVLGLIFWPTAIVLWFAFRRKLSRTVRGVGTILVIGLPTLAILSMGWWLFVSEPLLSAAEEGDVSHVQYLLAIGASPNLEENGYTALSFAAGNGHTEVVRILLAHGADVNRGDHENTAWDHRPLAMAKQGKHDDIVALLRQAGAKESQ